MTRSADDDGSVSIVLESIGSGPVVRSRRPITLEGGSATVAAAEEGHALRFSNAAEAITGLEPETGESARTLLYFPDSSTNSASTGSAGLTIHHDLGATPKINPWAGCPPSPLPW